MIVIALSVIAWKFTVSTVAYQRRVSAARIKIITVTIVSIFLANQRRVTATRIKHDCSNFGWSLLANQRLVSAARITHINWPTGSFHCRTCFPTVQTVLLTDSLNLINKPNRRLSH